MKTTHPTRQLRSNLQLKPLVTALALAGLLGNAAVFAQATPSSSEDLPKLSTIVVTSPKPETDGTGSYTSPAVTVAGKTPLALKEIANSVSVLTRQQMDDQGLVTTGEAMQQMTGVNVIANDTANNQYFIRGYGLGVMFDGVSSYNGMTPSHQFDLPLYESIEVLRGPAGLLRGVGEPGGVVNFVKKRPKAAFAVSGGVSVGSWNNKRAGVDVTGALNADNTLRGRVVASTEDRGYFYDHTHGQKWLAFGALEYDLTPRTTVSLSYSAQDQDVTAPWSGLPTSSAKDAAGHFVLLDVPRSTFNVPDWGKLLYHTAETSLSAEHKFDNQWVAKAQINHRAQRQYYKYAYASTSVDAVTHLVSYSSFQGDYDYTRDGYDLYANGPFELFGRKHNLLVGYNYDLYNSTGVSGNGPKFNNLVFGNVSSIVEPAIAYTSGSVSETVQSGLYSQLRLSLADPLTLVVGGRTTTFKIKTRNMAPATPTAWVDGAKADNQFTPYAGLIYAVNKDVTVYGSYADIFVPQTQKKADGGTLDPRTGRQYELGSKADFLDGKLWATFAVFNLRDKNRAYADPAYPNSSFYLNAGEIESKGWEIEVTGKPLPGFDISAGFTHVTTQYLADRSNEGRTYSIQTPENQLKLWGNYRFDTHSALAGFTVGVGLQANSDAQSSRGWRDEVVNTGYAVVNSRITYQVAKNYSVSLAVNNLFDQKYYASVGTPNTYNFYGEPRNVLLALRVSM